MPIQDKLADLQQRLAHEFSNIQHLQEQLNFFHSHWHRPGESLFPDITSRAAGSAADTSSTDPSNAHRILKEEFLKYLLDAINNCFPQVNNVKLKGIFVQLNGDNRALKIITNQLQLGELDYFDPSDVLYDEHSIIFCLCLCRAVFADIVEQNPDNKQEALKWIELRLETEILTLYDEILGGQPQSSASAFAPGTQPNTKKEDGQFEEEVFDKCLSDIHTPFDLEELQNHFDGSDATRMYHRQWIPYILEETRDAISQQLRLIEYKKPPCFKVTIENVTRTRDAAHHSTVTLKCTTQKLPETDHAFAKEAICLLPDTSRGGTKCTPILAIASVKFSDKQSGLHHLQIRISIEDLVKNEALFNSTRQWEGQHLAGLIGFSRMFAACQHPALPPFISQITSGVLPPWPEQDLVARFQSSHVKTKLNPSQFAAVSSFCQAEEGFFCLQGPPGTGKSTTVVEALSVLSQDPSTKIIVTTPSNKATQLLASRTIQAHPELVIALTGVAKNLPKHLQHIFINDHATLISNQLSAAFRPLNAAHHEILESAPKSSRSSEYKQHIEKLFNDFGQQIQSCIEQLNKLLTPSQFPIKAEVRQAVESLVSVFIKAKERIEAKIDGNIKAINTYKTAQKQTLNGKKKPIPGTPQYIKHQVAAKKLRQSSDALEKSCQYFYQLYQELQSQLRSCAENIEILLLQRAQIVFCTLVSSGRPWLQKHIHRVDVVIVDEAAQCTVPETLIPLKFNPRTLLHVGDPRQLPATIKSRAAQERGYGDSLMLRMMETRGQPFKLLNTQYRMHPKICEFPSQQYYGGQLLSAEGLQSRTSPLADAPLDSRLKSPNIFFNIANGCEERDVGYSKSIHNVAECNALIKVLAQLLPHLTGHTVGVITFYNAQVTLLKRALERLAAPNKNNVTISTVDGFQGEEKDVVLLSMVRTSPDVGFLKDRRRQNVAATRPRHHLMIFGNRNSLIESRSDVGLLAGKFGQPGNTDYHLIEDQSFSTRPSSGGGGK